MKRLGLACASLLVASSAFAQQPPGPQLPFEPYTITQEQHQSLLDYLYKQVPGQYADPLRNALMQFEQNAQQQVRLRAEEAKKAAEANKSTPGSVPQTPMPPRSPVPPKPLEHK